MGFFDLFKKKKKKDGEKEFKKIKQKGSVFAQTVQQILDFDSITETGIIVSKDKKSFSKLYSLIDANFVSETEDKQVDILINYTKLVNKFPDNTIVSIIIVNRRNTKEQLAEMFHLHDTGDEYDIYRHDYNSIIDNKIDNGNADISKEKYIMLTIKAKNLNAAENDFATAENGLQEATKTINKVGVKPLGAVARLRLMSEILKGSEGLVPFDKEFARYITRTPNPENDLHEDIVELNMQALKKDGVSVKDLVAPQIIAKEKNISLQLDENRFCRSFAYKTLPTSLDTSFLTKSTDLPYEMVTVIQLKPCPSKKAASMVKVMNNNIKADVIKASQRAYQNGYDPALMDEGLKHAQEQASKLRNDVLIENKKLFFATMVVTCFAKSIEELDTIAATFKSNCQDFSVNPSLLLGEQIEGLNSSILCGESKVLIDRMLTNDNCCALFPFNIQEITDKRGHFYGSNAISHNLIMYDRKRSPLGNGLVFGQSGSGKSFYIKGEIIPNLLSTEDDIIILDPENEYRIIADTFGGTVIDLSPNTKYHINPCDLTMEWEEKSISPLVEKCDFMVGLVEAIYGRVGGCSSFEVSAIHRVCNKIYEPYIAEMTKRHDEGDNSTLDTEICPTLRDFYEALHADGTPEALKIAMAIEPYCIGSYNLFSHKTNIDVKSRLTIFTMLYLPQKMKEMAMKVCLSHIWSKIVENKENNQKFNTHKSIWVYLDEFHLFFNSTSSIITIKEYFKRVRKYGGIMTGITQDVADLLRNSEGTGMFNNSGFFVFFSQSNIGRNNLQSVLEIPDSLMEYVRDKPFGIGLLYNNSITIPIDYKIPTSSMLYKIMSTNPNDETKNLMIKAEVAKERIPEVRVGELEGTTAKASGE